MVRLSIEQYDVLQRYSELLDTVEEGFEYVIDSFTNLELSNSDLVLQDIFSALSSISVTSEELELLFQNKQEVLKAIQYFDGVMTEVIKLEGQFDNQSRKQQLIKSNIFPAYQAWKEGIQKKLSPYILQ